MVLLKRKFWIFLQFTSILIVIIFIVDRLYLSTIRKSSQINQQIDPNVLKDWNDYELIREESLRVGYGEHGKGEELTDANEIAENKKLFDQYGMNIIISDKMSVNRSVPEFRHPKCFEKKYLRKLPKVSIIIIFIDEAFSVFKRTLHSLYNRTPHELIEEVILVNDHSSKEYLYGPLKRYIDENFPYIKFNIINLKKRHGLMQARVIGAKAAKSEFLFVSEPHCEMTYNWLPPLLQPLLSGEKIVTVPIIDNIEYTHLEYYQNDKGNKGSRGVFDWNLEYQKLSRFPVNDSEKELDPFTIPVMTGGVYMIRKSYFFEIGPYDPELIIWGAENIEMSLKIHLCGGQLLEVPCSHIGHMFRAYTKSRRHESGIDFEAFNRKRVVEVWFDDYKDFVYMRNNDRYERIEVGDLTQAKEFKKSLKCKPFEYFLKVVAPDLLEAYPLTQNPFAYGQITLFDESLCIEAYAGENAEISYPVVLADCTDISNEIQNFELSWYRDIRLRKIGFCLDANELSSVLCHTQGGNQFFKYDIRTKQIISMAKKQCIEAKKDERVVIFAKCDETLKSQKWIFNEFVNETALIDWKNSGRPIRNGDDIFW